MLRARSSSSATVVSAAIRGPYCRISTVPVRGCRMKWGSSVPTRTPATDNADSTTSPGILVICMGVPQ